MPRPNAVVATHLIEPDPNGAARAGVVVQAQRLRYTEDDDAESRQFELAATVRSTASHDLAEWHVDVQAFDEDGFLVLTDDYNEVRRGREPGTGHVLVTWDDELDQPLPGHVRLVFRPPYDWADGEGAVADVDEQVVELPEKSAGGGAGKAKFPAVSKRGLALLAKDPEAHRGDRYTMFCKVTQLDSATGPDAFMADASAGFDADEYFDGSSAWFVARKEGQFADVVEGDVLRVKVSCVGEYAYTTVMGAERTIPSFTVEKLRVEHYND